MLVKGGSKIEGQGRGQLEKGAHVGGAAGTGLRHSLQPCGRHTGQRGATIHPSLTSFSCGTHQRLELQRHLVLDIRLQVFELRPREVLFLLRLRFRVEGLGFRV